MPGFVGKGFGHGRIALIFRGRKNYVGRTRSRRFAKPHVLPNQYMFKSYNINDENDLREESEFNFLERSTIFGNLLNSGYIAQGSAFVSLSKESRYSSSCLKPS